MKAIKGSRWIVLVGLSLVGALLGAGCVLNSGQFVVIFKIAEVMASTSEQISVKEIDLTDDEDFNDHKDELKRVEDVLFQLTATNNGTTTAHARIYISDTDTLSTFAEIDTLATLVLESPELGVSESLFIPFDDSGDYIQNVDVLRDLTLTGHFYAYAVADNVPFNMTLENVIVVATLTFAP